jgi:protein-S-isoprenylcysteine O-methyltransferase Ste14
MFSSTIHLVGALLAFAFAGLAYRFLPADPERQFYLPIFFLILYHTMVAVATNATTYEVRPAWTAARKAVGKYIFWFLIIGGVYWFYENHPFYRVFAVHTRQMLWCYLWLYAIGGLPYFVFVERYRYSRFEMLNDPYLRVLSLLRSVTRLDGRKLMYRLFRRGYKSLLLSWILRLHYLPVMVEQVHYGISRIAGILGSSDYQFGVESTAAFFVIVLFCIDSNTASMGYFWESTLTRTRFREADPHPFHWMVTLVCYYPFIKFAGTFFPFPAGAEGSPLLIDHSIFRVAVNVCTIVALGGMVIATTSLGFSFSNLCYKKIQTSGPYRLVRHPATVGKLSFFFFAIFRYKSSFCFATITLYLIWCTIYVTRAICEERFLRQFPEYRAYMEKVRYRFIPGIL